MNPRVCICCGQAIAEKPNTLSRNPNLCASCSGLSEGMDDSAVSLMARKASTKSGKTFAAADSLHNQGGAFVVQ